MNRKRLIKEFSVGIASLALITPLMLGGVHSTPVHANESMAQLYADIRKSEENEPKQAKEQSAKLGRKLQATEDKNDIHLVKTDPGEAYIDAQDLGSLSPAVRKAVKVIYPRDVKKGLVPQLNGHYLRGSRHHARKYTANKRNHRSNRRSHKRIAKKTRAKVAQHSHAKPNRKNQVPKTHKQMKMASKNAYRIHHNSMFRKGYKAMRFNARKAYPLLRKYRHNTNFRRGALAFVGNDIYKNGKLYGSKRVVNEDWNDIYGVLKNDYHKSFERL